MFGSVCWRRESVWCCADGFSNFYFYFQMGPPRKKRRVASSTPASTCFCCRDASPRSVGPPRAKVSRKASRPMDVAGGSTIAPLDRGMLDVSSNSPRCDLSAEVLPLFPRFDGVEDVTCSTPSVQGEGPRRQRAAPRAPHVTASASARSVRSDMADRQETYMVQGGYGSLDSRDRQIPHTVPVAPEAGMETDGSSSDSESDLEDIQSVRDVVSEDASGLLPGTGMQYAEPISSLILQQVNTSLRKKIWRNRFIDLGLLLPSLLSAQSHSPQFTLQMDKHSNLSVQSSSRARKITNIDMWTTAFLRFAAVYAVRFPFETPALMKYAELVRELAVRRPGQACFLYDQQFRILRETVLFPWDRMHTEFWLMACTSVSQPTHNQSFRSPYRGMHRQSSFQSVSRRFLDNTCWNFNKRPGCRVQKCAHPHVCGYCRGPHAAFNCHNSGTDQSTSASAIQKTLSTVKTGK